MNEIMHPGHSSVQYCNLYFTAQHVCTLTSKQQCALKRGFNRHQKVSTVAFSGRRESHGQRKDCFGVAPQTGFESWKKPVLFSIIQFSFLTAHLFATVLIIKK